MDTVMRRFITSVSVGLVSLLLMAATSSPVLAQSAAKGASGLPLPRFVSLKSKRVNLRVGPGTDYAVSWLYLKSGLPVEIMQEYDTWRRIRDADGTEGWVNHSLLSGERTALTAPWMKGKGQKVYVNLRKEPETSSTVIARIEPGVVIQIGQCNGDWCKADADGTEGWVSQGEIWGAYPGEAFKQ